MEADVVNETQNNVGRAALLSVTQVMYRLGYVHVRSTHHCTEYQIQKPSPFHRIWKHEGYLCINDYEATTTAHPLA